MTAATRDDKGKWIGGSGNPLGRPKIKPTRDAAAKIAQYASEGFSSVGIAQKLGIARKTLERWLADEPGLREALEIGRETERHSLHNFLYREAMENGNATAAMFLLKARHGYKEGDQTEQANRVQIVFSLPAALKPAEFIDAGSAQALTVSR